MFAAAEPIVITIGSGELFDRHERQNHGGFVTFRWASAWSGRRLSCR